MQNGDIYSVDVLNCKEELLGKTGILFHDISYTTDGRLWGISSGGALYEIDTITYSATYVGDTKTPYPLTLVELDDTTLIVDGYTELFKLNTNTLLKTSLGVYRNSALDFAPTGDLTWFNDTLYMSCFEPNHRFLLKIELNPSKTKIISTHKTDKAPIATGLVTVSLPDENPFFGFYGNNVYKICHEDGSYKKVCSILLNLGVDPQGAATMKLPALLPEKGPCSYLDSIPDPPKPFFLPNVFTPNNDGINDSWELNPFPTYAIIQIINQWGQPVIDDVKIRAEEIYKWDGGNCNTGIYYYIITTAYDVYNGCISLIR